ncbi:hypothetical protein P3X46_032829 [Hevea brasiliensis]|uniref:Uncharacterized protein n=1 Tax=Hevea brasiliensis TaxID=3981 RepID=A0ABQ9KFR7_HEVBR|nr:hypothetical protein P3X46_032829 [Hevea brasiliensis]
MKNCSRGRTDEKKKGCYYSGRTLKISFSLLFCYFEVLIGKTFETSFLKCFLKKDFEHWNSTFPACSSPDHAFTFNSLSSLFSSLLLELKSHSVVILT